MDDVWILAAVVPGLWSGHGSSSALNRRLATWVDAAQPHACGGLVDGVFCLGLSAKESVELGLVLAKHGAAVGVAFGDAEPGVAGGPPVGGPMLTALVLARAVRMSEVAIRGAHLSSNTLPSGVGRFAAPDGLVPHVTDLAILVDYRDAVAIH
ncbi:MAG: hypothetical protein AB8H79_13305 [Myxococcota bacterium]